jgi:pantoate--beta-alanine ligase
MIVIRTVSVLRKVLAVRKAELYTSGLHSEIGFVPTMGFLHDGHASLMKRARSECGIVVLSVFVNPLQFGPNEDFERYPRDEARDSALAEACGVDFVFMPAVHEMYSQPSKTNVSVSKITERLCGASRPGHFDGVCTVVSKLFHIVDPDRAYFGLKDAQQVAVIQQMVDDLNMRVQIVPCPTIREEDGLAKSSRNVYLQKEEREQALVLSRVLSKVDRWLQESPDDIQVVHQRIVNTILQQPLAKMDYVEIVHYPSLEPIQSYRRENGALTLVALAVRFGGTRLIDNRLLEYTEQGE